MRRLIAFLFLLTATYAAVPRTIANIPIQTPDRKNINLREYRGKVMILILFSTTCADCLQTVEMLNHVQADFGKRGFQVVGAAIENNSAYNVGPFNNRYRPSFPVGFLNQPEAVKMMDMPAGMRPFVPILMFIDGKGTVRFQYYGNDAFMKQGEKGIRAVADGLIRQAAENAAKAAAEKSAPAAPKAEPTPAPPGP